MSAPCFRRISLITHIYARAWLSVGATRLKDTPRLTNMIEQIVALDPNLIQYCLVKHSFTPTTGDQPDLFLWNAKVARHPVLGELYRAVKKAFDCDTRDSGINMTGWVKNEDRRTNVIKEIIKGLHGESGGGTCGDSDGDGGVGSVDGVGGVGGVGGGGDIGGFGGGGVGGAAGCSGWCGGGGGSGWCGGGEPSTEAYQSGLGAQVDELGATVITQGAHVSEMRHNLQQYVYHTDAQFMAMHENSKAAYGYLFENIAHVERSVNQLWEQQETVGAGKFWLGSKQARKLRSELKKDVGQEALKVLKKELAQSHSNFEDGLKVVRSVVAELKSADEGARSRSPRSVSTRSRAFARSCSRSSTPSPPASTSCRSVT